MTIRIKRGLDLPIAGMPTQRLAADSVSTQTVALLGGDYVGLKPNLRVAEGERVCLGQPVFEDRATPGVQFTAPASGIVAAIHRGARRRLQSVVIQCDGNEERAFECWSRSALSDLDPQAVRANLLASGLWTSFRTRPFDRVPTPESMPAAIFVTAIDTNPLAADPNLVISADATAFHDGVRVIRALTEGKVYICAAPGNSILENAIERVETVNFSGPHPAGLVGTHVHFLAPVSHERIVWHLNYQDVIAIGRLFTTGRLDATRIVSIAGPRVRNPRLLRVPLGAHLEELLRGELLDGASRSISGSVLSGRRAAGAEAYLGRYHLQVSAIEEQSSREFLGWLAPGKNKFSASGMFLSSVLPKRFFDLSTSQNGSPRALVPIGSFEKVMPLNVLITPLLKALLVNDTETAIALGCLELVEEDLALCSFVCNSKYNYGEALRDTLASIEKTG
ncbi:MAG TPA: Na(+)-translocating NADH-quinone reductase subunit A [Woeseiaceae bacterium]|nr:Na(+)-translocating NADH-quinone reductase subunit A [Woeseiaceae bacterium]